MTPAFIRRSTLLLAAVAALGACQDKRVKEITPGISRDSVLSLTARGTVGADSMPGIYKRAHYLIEGKTLEVLYFDSKDRKAGKDTVPNSQLTPLVILDGKLVGKGWSVWDSAAKANNIPVEKH